MIVKIQTKVNFNFHKVQKRVVEQLISSRLNKIANTALSKVRKTFFTEKDITEKDLIKEVMEENELKKYFKDKQILKKFYVQNKIINFILK